MTPRYILACDLDGEAGAVGGVLEKSELGACLNLESAEVEGLELADLQLVAHLEIEGEPRNRRG